jgi:hypothetical protein
LDLESEGVMSAPAPVAMVCRGSGFAYRTRGTGQIWWDLESWTRAAWSILDHPDDTNANRVLLRHLSALDLRTIEGAEDLAALEEVIELLRSPELLSLKTRAGRLRLDFAIGDTSIAAKARIYNLRLPA